MRYSQAFEKWWESQEGILWYRNKFLGIEKDTAWYIWQAALESQTLKFVSNAYTDIH